MVKKRRYPSASVIPALSSLSFDWDLQYVHLTWYMFVCDGCFKTSLHRHRSKYCQFANKDISVWSVGCFPVHAPKGNRRFYIHKMILQDMSSSALQMLLILLTTPEASTLDPLG